MDMSDAAGTGEARGGQTLGQLPAGYDGLGEARRLLRTTRSGALSTLDRASGIPMATLATLATDPGGAPILLFSQLSAHTKNLDADPRCSILLSAGGKGDLLAHPRLTIFGRAIKETDEMRSSALRTRFLARHPKAALYADFGDFSFWRMDVAGAHLNGGFAKAADYGTEILADLEGTQNLIEAEAGALEHMNADHPETLGLYAEKLAGLPAARWRATGIDPLGLDLAAGDQTARITFPERVTSPGQLRNALSALAKIARSKA